MVKTMPMDENTHMFFKKTQLTLSEKYMINLTMSEIMTAISYTLISPEEAAGMIMRVRHAKYENMILSGNESDKNSKNRLSIVDHKLLKSTENQ